MTGILKSLSQKYFADPQAVYLAFLLVLGFSIVIFMGVMLLPVFAGLIIAYLLDEIVQLCQRCGARRNYSVFVVFILYLAIFAFLFLGLIPFLFGQIGEFDEKLPAMISRGQQALLGLPEAYSFISEEHIARLISTITEEVGSLSQKIISQTFSTLNSLITIIVYLVLVPLLVFFFLKDKWKILNWFDRFMPEKRTLMVNLWTEMDTQLGNYIRGKFWEVLIVGIASGIVFSIFGLQYAILLGALVGLSVVVPYVGAVVVTFPVVLVAYFQWGWSADFAYLIIAFTIIQAIDGLILVPVMFSEVVNLHPIAIIVAVLFFGGLWGFWGVFFAIPLATLVQALISAWPRQNNQSATSQTEST